MRLRRFLSVGTTVALFVAPAVAWAQGNTPAPLPPLPSPEPQYAPPPPQAPQPYYPPPQSYSPSYPPTYGPQPYTQPYSRTPPPPYYSPYYAPPPPPVAYYERPSEPYTHAPRFSLWTGARLGYMGFGGGFYGGTNSGGEYTETTGNLVSPGPSLQLDVGVRLGRRYVPFVFYEHDFLRAGRRFAGDDATAYSDFYGIGFRYTAGDVNSAGFLTELSIGYRNVSITDNGQTYTMTAFELFRLGLGAEVRLSTLFVLSPMISISTGSMTDTSGSVNFSKQGQADGATSPAFVNGAEITDQRGYVTVSVSCGAHFDVFGK